MGPYNPPTVTLTHSLVCLCPFSYLWLPTPSYLSAFSSPHQGPACPPPAQPPPPQHPLNLTLFLVPLSTSWVWVALPQPQAVIPLSLAPSPLCGGLNTQSSHGCQRGGARGGAADQEWVQGPTPGEHTRPGLPFPPLAPQKSAACPPVPHHSTLLAASQQVTDAGFLASSTRRASRILTLCC